MKNLSLLLTQVLLASGLNAQNPYHPMLVEGRSWDIFITPTEQSICAFTSANHYFLNGDTLLDGKMYKKLYFNQIQSNPPAPFCQDFYLDTSAQFPNYAFYREDTLTRKVFMSIPDVPEFAIFDFTLQTGDTLHYPDQDFPILEVFDFELANGDHRKAFKIGEWLDNFYVEGIGYMLGAFSPVFYPFEGWDLTTCVRDGSETLFTSGPGCVAPISATQSPEASNFEISPNPFQDHLTLKIPEHKIAQPAVFELFDLTGRILIQKGIEGQSGKILINLPPLMPGIYGWSVNGSLKGRLVKM